MTLSLKTPVSNLRMIGPSYTRRLHKLKINTVRDLLFHAPHRYEDFSHIVPINTVQPGETVTLQGIIVNCKNIFSKSGKVIQKATLKDRTGSIEATWFNQTFIPKILKNGLKASFSGKIDGTRLRPKIISPEYEILNNNRRSRAEVSRATIHTGRLVPVYPETQGISSKWLRSRIAPLISMVVPVIIDWIPKDIIKKENLLSLPESLSLLHFPNSLTEAQRAHNRLAFEEMLFLQLRSLFRKKQWQQQKVTSNIKTNQSQIKSFLISLPFTLTAAQKRCIREILQDISTNLPMNRLLLGDVGSGKTVVAAIAIYCAYKSGLRSIFMAPTEILVLQHEKTLRELLTPFGLSIAVCTASKKINLEKFDVVVGTHALLFDTLKTQHFGLLVIDEQHRFGVEQRSLLIKKGKIPHTLTMTATPIPRSVALTLYGDLDISLIDEMPKGRITIKTWTIPVKKRDAAYDWIKKQIKTDAQAFIVCPLIETSAHESMIQVKAATDEYNKLSQKIFPEFKIGLLHGKMKAKDKDAVISKFRNGKLDLLVTTPVVEVGIDIPNATIMIIEGAERFGLAQLHQLRGRVGRGKKQSYCLLFTSTPNSSGYSRLKALEKIHSGHILADLDLKLRGPGDIYGTKQHGFPELKFASYSDIQLITKTRSFAQQLLSRDPYLSSLKYPNSQMYDLLVPIQPN